MIAKFLIVFVCLFVLGMTPRLLTLEGQFWFPGNRELVLGAGCCAATKRGMEALLGQPGKRSRDFWE